MAANDNPYLALLQQEQKPPGWAEILQHIGNLGFGLAGGFGQAAATGQPTMAAIGPGLMMGNQLNAQAAQQAEQARLKRAEIGIQASEWEHKRALELRKQQALEAFTGGGGFNVVPPPGPLMGPTPQAGSYDTKVAGLEGGTKKGGMVFNELGSGAYGPYQFMPATWAAVRAQNPQLNLPADITQASREQHDAAHGAFKAGNAQGLQAAGFQPTPENLYLAHRFGLGGATAVLRADPEKPLHEVLPIDWQRQNPDMRGQTAGGFRRLAAERVGGSSVPYVVRPDARPTQYSLMPDDVPLSLSSGETTLPRPTTAQPTFTAPVMPQPTWDAPSDIARVNPGSWFQPPAVPGGGPAPGGVDAPPTYVPPPVPRLDPQTEARINAGVAGGIFTPEKGIELKRQIVEDQYKKAEEAAKAQHATALEVYKQRQEGGRHERGEKARLEAEARAEERRIAAEERRQAKADEQTGTKRGDEQTKARIDDENKLRDDFDKSKQVQAYRTVVPMLESARKAGPTRAGDLNLVYAFAKLMDPESVVRESETGMVTATGSFGDRLAGLTSQLSGQQALSDEMRKKLLAELDTRFAGLKASYDAHEEAYRGIAERRGLDFDNIRIPIRPNKPAEDKPAAVSGPVYDASGKIVK